MVVQLDEVDCQDQFGEVAFVRVLCFPDDPDEPDVLGVHLALGRDRFTLGCGERPRLAVSQCDLPSRPKAGSSAEEFVNHSLAPYPVRSWRQTNGASTCNFPLSTLAHKPLGDLAVGELRWVLVPPGGKSENKTEIQRTRPRAPDAFLASLRSTRMWE